MIDSEQRLRQSPADPKNQAEMPDADSGRRPPAAKPTGRIRVVPLAGAEDS